MATGPCIETTLLNLQPYKTAGLELNWVHKDSQWWLLLDCMASINPIKEGDISYSSISLQPFHFLSLMHTAQVSPKAIVPKGLCQYEWQSQLEIISGASMRTNCLKWKLYWTTIYQLFPLSHVPQNLVYTLHTRWLFIKHPTAWFC